MLQIALMLSLKSFHFNVIQWVHVESREIPEKNEVSWINGSREEHNISQQVLCDPVDGK